MAIDLRKSPEFLAFTDSMIHKLQEEYENYRKAYFLKCKTEFRKSINRSDEAEN